MALSLLRSQQQLLCAGQSFATHPPAFRLEEFEAGRWWVLDGATRVGLVLADQLVIELVNHDPFAPRTVEFPALYHAPTQPGERLTLAHWVNGIGGTTSQEHDLCFEVDDAGVSVILRERWEDGRRATKRATFCIDPDFGYSIRGTSTMSTPNGERPGCLPEFTNFLPRGVTDDRPESGARYPFVLWQHPDGEVVRWNQNNVSARALGALDALGQRRVASDGFFAFCGEADFNVALEFVEASPGLTTTTCPNMLDEHMQWTLAAPGQEARYHVRFNLVAFSPQVSEALAARASRLDLALDRYDPAAEAGHEEHIGDYPRRMGQPYDLRFYPLAMGQIADFGTPLDANLAFRGQVFPYLQDSDDPITVTSRQAHRGARCLQIKASGESLCAFPIGGSLHVTTGQGYRLSAWVKTDLRVGSARLCALEYLFSRDNVTGRHSSDPLNGCHDWTPLCVEFVAGPNAHVVDVRFEVEGQGTAWADEILLEKVA